MGGGGDNVLKKVSLIIQCSMVHQKGLFKVNSVALGVEEK